MENILSRQKVNCGRQLELDIARALAVVFMVLVHVYELFIGHPLPDTVSTRIITFLGSPPAAPVFMLLLGVGIAYSKRTSAAYLFKRGIITLIMAYTLGLLRDALPAFIKYLVQGDTETLELGLLNSVGVDILQFAGLTFLFFSLVIKLKLKIWQIFLCVLVFSTLGVVIGETSTGIFGLDVLAGLFWGSWDYSWFPFFSWIFFPAAGFVFGTILMYCNDKTKMYRIILITSALLLIPLTILSRKYKIEFGAFGEYYHQQYYHQDLLGNIVIAVFVFFWISLLYFAVFPLKNRSFNTLKRWSKNVTEIYFIHWLILGILDYLVIDSPLSVWTTIVLAAAILIVSDFIAYQYIKFKAKYSERK